MSGDAFDLGAELESDFNSVVGRLRTENEALLERCMRNEKALLQMNEEKQVVSKIQFDELNEALEQEANARVSIRILHEDQAANADSAHEAEIGQMEHLLEEARGCAANWGGQLAELDAEYQELIDRTRELEEVLAQNGIKVGTSVSP